VTTTTFRDATANAKRFFREYADARTPEQRREVARCWAVREQAAGRVCACSRGKIQVTMQLPVPDGNVVTVFVFDRSEIEP
jgi:hypothetical protein